MRFKKWPRGGGVAASQTTPAPYFRHSLLSFLILGSFSIGFWISTSIPKLMYFPSFLFDMGVSWGGVILTLLASAGMKKPCNKLCSLSYFWDETRRDALVSGVSRWTSTEKEVTEPSRNHWTVTKSLNRHETTEPNRTTNHWTVTKSEEKERLLTQSQSQPQSLSDTV